jgi:hypothetical protein
MKLGKIACEIRTPWCQISHGAPTNDSHNRHLLLMYGQIVLGFRCATMKHNPCARRRKSGNRMKRGLSRTSRFQFSTWGDDLADWSGLFSEGFGHLGKCLSIWKAASPEELVMGKPLVQQGAVKDGCPCPRCAANRGLGPSGPVAARCSSEKGMKCHSHVSREYVARGDLCPTEVGCNRTSTNEDRCSTTSRNLNFFTPCYCTLKSTETWVFSQANLSTPVSSPVRSREIVNCSIGVSSDSFFRSMRAKSSF